MKLAQTNCPNHPQRALVLDYLCHNCYTRTAKAFAQDSTVRHLDADGDEISGGPKGFEGKYPGLSENRLKQVELREGRQPVEQHSRP